MSLKLLETCRRKAAYSKSCFDRKLTKHDNGQRGDDEREGERGDTLFCFELRHALSFFFVKLLFRMKDTKGTAPTGSQKAENKPFEISNLFIDGPPGASWKIILSARDREQLPEGVVVKKMTLEFWSLNVLLFSTQQLF